MTDKFLSCNGHGLSPAQFIAGFMPVASKLPEGFGFTDSDVIFTHQGRYAVYLICQLLGIGKGDEILCPAYNCGAEIDPFVWAGANVAFYRIDEHAFIDQEDIIRRITPATKVVYISHFWGWPQDMKEIAQYCKEKGIFLLEDCALCLFSQSPDRTMGQRGDATIYSFVKSLPVPDGGALVLHNGTIPDAIKPLSQPKHKNIIFNSFPLLKKWFMNSNKLWQRYDFTRRLLNKSWLRGTSAKNTDIEREMPQSNYFDPLKIGWTISNLSRRIICKVNPGKIVETRRQNYRHLHNALYDLQGIQLLFKDLPENVSPHSFPFYVRDRNHWCQKLESKGILVGGWPSYHRGFNWTDFPEARHLKNDLVTLPVHQDLDFHHMDYIIHCVKSIAGNNDHPHR